MYREFEWGASLFLVLQSTLFGFTPSVEKSEHFTVVVVVMVVVGWEGCISCLEYWVLASCLQYIVIAIDVFTVQTKGSTATQGKAFPRQGRSTRGEWKPKGLLKAFSSELCPVASTPFYYSSNSYCQAPSQGSGSTLLPQWGCSMAVDVERGE